MASLPPFFNSQFLGVTGLPAAGYLLYAFESGTSTPKDTYTDQDEGAENEHPIELDAAGRCSLWLGSGEYSFELRTPADALVERWDDVAGMPVASEEEFVPLEGGVTMTGRYNLAGAAQSGLQPTTLTQVQDLIATAVATLTAAVSAATPVGTIVAWLQGTLPTGWLALEGGTGSRTTHAALFALWSTTYGTGDGSTTFGLPDLRGRFPRGWDNAAGVDVGRALGTAQDDAFEAHTHSLAAGADAGHTYVAGGGDAFKLTFGPTATASTGDTETRPKNFSVRFIVKAA